MSDFYSENKHELNNRENFNASSAAESGGRTYVSGYTGMSSVRGVVVWVLGLALNTLITSMVVTYYVDKKYSVSPGASTVPNYYTSQNISSVGSNSQGQSANAGGFTDVAASVGPAIVGITNTQKLQTYFGTQDSSNSGSGIIFREDGYILTNNHVVENASDSGIKVTLSTGAEYPGKIIGKDSRSDLAVIKIEATGLPVAVFGDSSSVRVGESVLAIGNPYGQELAGSVTSGIVSALNRTLTVENRQFTLIQTDAAINPGNSGGALVNSKGEVIGINTVSMLSAEGLSFAIPSNTAAPIIDDIINYGYVKGRPVIGVVLSDISELYTKRLGVPAGARVLEVMPGSGAEKGGILADDIIVAVQGTSVASQAEVDAIKGKFKAGETISIDVRRFSSKTSSWELLSLSATLTEEKGE